MASAVTLREIASVPYAVLTPEGPGPLPLCVFLLGAGGTRENLVDLQPVFDGWWNEGLLPPMAVVVPTPGPDYIAWDSFLAEDLIPQVRAEFHASEAVVIAGISGGGYGALKLAFAPVSYTHLDVYKRQDRVDVVTRGFLGLTVACARCHDHKYDPIPQTDYYALGGVFLNTAYREYPLVPKTILDKYTKLEDEVEAKQKVQSEMQNNLSAALSESLAFQTSNYVQGVYEVVGQKKEIDQVVENRKLDYELLERWMAYIGKTTDKYHDKEAFQAFLKKARPAVGGAGGRRGGGGAVSYTHLDVYKRQAIHRSSNS